MTLPVRPLGTSDHISTVGLGAWAIGGGGWASSRGRRTTRPRWPP